jgi:hypothetical protein
MAGGNMTFSQADFPHLKWSLLIFLCVLCASGATVVTSKNFVAHAQHEQHATQRHLNTVRSQLASADEDRRNMKAYTFEYGELLKRNIIGNDQRLDWIEGLEKIRKQHRVLDFKYTIAPQHPYTPHPTLGSGNFELNMSDMTLQFDLLHEEQLLDFFDTLRTGINGWFILDRCAMERSADSDATVKLKAECTGGWLTLKNRNAK